MMPRLTQKQLLFSNHNLREENAHLRARNAAMLAALENMGRDCKACGRWHMTGCDHYFACEGPDVCDPRCLIAQAAITAEKGE